MAGQDDDAVVPHEPQSLDELKRLEAELAPLTHSRARPEVLAANRVVGAADELGRLLISLLLVTGLLIVLAVTVSPWFWIAVAAWVALGITGVVLQRRRGRRGQVERAILRAPEPPDGPAGSR